MSKRNSEYARKERDLYETPRGPIEALLDTVELRNPVWEPACGGGRLVEVMRSRNYDVAGSDLPYDFRKIQICYGNTIITNPPFKLATEFIEHGLKLTMQRSGMLVLLLPTEFDHAITRTRLFRDCPVFAGEVKLLKRIVWFERTDGKKAAPSENHSWFVWDWRREAHAEPWVRYATWL